MGVGRQYDKEFAGNWRKVADIGLTGTWDLFAGLVGNAMGALVCSSCEGQADKLAEVRIRPFQQVDGTGALDKADKVGKLEVVGMECLDNLLFERVGRLLSPLVAQLEQFYLAWSPEHLLLVPLQLLRF